MIPDLCIDDPSEGRLSHGAKYLGGGFILLCAHKGNPSPLWECEAEVLCNFFPAIQRGVEIPVIRWAKLQLPTGQNCNSAWKETLKRLEKRRTVWKVKVCCACIFLWLLHADVLNALDMSRQ